METNTNTPIFKLNMPISFDDQIADFKFYVIFTNQDERDAFAATMPKSLKPHFFTAHGSSAGVQFYLQVSASLVPTKNNMKNETGIKRFRKFVELYAGSIDCTGQCENNVKSLEEAIMRVDALDN